MDFQGGSILSASGVVSISCLATRAGDYFMFCKNIVLSALTSDPFLMESAYFKSLRTLLKKTKKKRHTKSPNSNVSFDCELQKKVSIVRVLI